MNKHDKIATRLSLILTKLNNGERLSVEALAKKSRGQVKGSDPK